MERNGFELFTLGESREPLDGLSVLVAHAMRWDRRLDEQMMDERRPAKRPVLQSLIT